MILILQIIIPTIIYWVIAYICFRFVYRKRLKQEFRKRKKLVMYINEPHIWFIDIFECPDKKKGASSGMFAFCLFWPVTIIIGPILLFGFWLIIKPIAILAKFQSQKARKERTEKKSFYCKEIEKIKRKEIEKTRGKKQKSAKDGSLAICKEDNIIGGLSI